MRLIGFIVVVPLLASCEFIPGTASHSEAKAKQAAAGALIDPSSAQFRNVTGRDGFVCGEINGKNRMGAYVGFTRFYVSTSDWEASLDPSFDPSLLVSSRRLCASPYGSSSCATAAEEEAKQIIQQIFNDTWSQRCASPVDSFSAPFDPTRGSNIGAPSILDGSPTNVTAPSVSNTMSDGNMPSETSPDYDDEFDGADLEAVPPPSRAEEPARNLAGARDQRETLDQEWLDRAISRPPPSSPTAPADRNEDRPD